MAYHPSPFCWYELATPDVVAAKAFYGKVFNWTFAPAGMGDRDYTLIKAGDIAVGGIFGAPPEFFAQGMPPNWMGYIAVDDVDAKARAIVDQGGFIHRGPEDIPGVGRFAIVGDPQGAGFFLFKPAPGDAPPAVPPGTPGHVDWHELHARDGAQAFAFYAKNFGWSADEQIPMGEMGVYQLFRTTTAAPVGGMMTKMPDTPVPFWQYYVNVEALDAAIERVRASGGQVIIEAHEVPGGSWVAPACIDPQGAFFAMVSARR